jgi:hypothetical protein|tara:strand:+ start:246 stop:515 length:270 start_codon:yes stop_codon:yes gene_type:complete
MRKRIWHIEVEYKWKNVRVVKGVKRPAKEYKKGTFVSCAVGDTVEELNKDGYLKNSIAQKIKSSTQIELEITGWKWREDMGMSNDVYKD